MVRISDARMSGTSYGTCILHVSPESHLGGPLALVQTGDMIELDVPSERSPGMLAMKNWPNAARRMFLPSANGREATSNSSISM